MRYFYATVRKTIENRHLVCHGKIAGQNVISRWLSVIVMELLHSLSDFLPQAGADLRLASLLGFTYCAFAQLAVSVVGRRGRPRQSGGR